MASRIIRHIPDTVTCCNLFSGCIASVMAYEMKYGWAAFFIILAALFDFLDGMLARLLNARSPIGKDIDSLADDVSFGFAPAMIVFSLFKEVRYPPFLINAREWISYSAFLIAVFSALRLAKFNVDTRQTTSFIGMPVPASALFWASLSAGAHSALVSEPFNAVCLFILVCVMSGLLVSEIPMFSLKFKNLTWADNKTVYVFVMGCVPLLALLGICGFAAIVAWYLILSVVTCKRNE